MYATFIRFLKRNEKTGYSRFSARTGDGAIAICEGIVPHYSKFTPLCITGTVTQEADKLLVNAAKVSVCGFSFEASHRFLMSDAFRGIGQLAAKHILNNSGDDIFSYVRSHEAFSFTVPDLSDTVLSRAFTSIRQYCDFEDLMNYLIGVGGDYFMANEMYEQYRDASISVIKDNPYTLLLAKAPFEMCETLAHSFGMENCDKKRVHSLVAYAFSLSKNSGNTRMEFHELYTLTRKLEKKCGYYMTSPLFIAEELIRGDYYLEECGDKLYVYEHSDYIAEEMIASSFTRLKRSARPYVGKIKVSDIESICGVVYSPGQKNAFDSLNEGISIVTGGPGTGKTTFLRGLLQKYEMDYPNGKVVLCAPTARASRRMQEITGKEATTVHKLLNLRPFDNIFTSPRFEIDADLLAVDECSMLDTYVAAKLFSSVKNGCIVVLIGDKDQLPSVGAGNVFSDISESGCVPVFALDRIFRQSEDNPIIENASRVISGNQELIRARNFVIKTLLNEDSILKELSSLIPSLLKRNVEYKVFTPSRKAKFPTGAIRVNRIIQECLGTDVEEITYGYNSFRVGDSVIFTANNYDKCYFNGQDGIIRDIQKHGNGYRIAVATDDTVIHLSGAEIDDLELGYALTAHKSQGGECDNAIIIVPKNPRTLLQRRLLYVEITRAKKNVLILSEGDAYKTAISSYGEIARNTGLAEKLKRISCTV